MKYTLLFIVLSLLVSGRNLAFSEASRHHNLQSQKTQSYICPMHPHIHGEKEGSCPICGMALTPMKKQDAATHDMENAMSIDPSLVQTIGIKTARVQFEIFGNDIRAYGRVVPSTRVESKLTLRLGGWIEELNASAVGDMVQEGQQVFTLNSPNLISAQTDYITAKKLGNKGIEKAAFRRLKQLGVDARAIKLISSLKEPLTAVPFHAPASGFITQLHIRNGEYVKPGMPLLSVQDLSTVWVEADVPERDVSSLKKGDKVRISLPEIGKNRVGIVNFIHPSVDPVTRTGQVRIELENPKGELKPDSFVDVIFSAEKRERLAVTHEAILRSSMGSYVLLWLGDGRFKSIMVTTGAKSDGFIEIMTGLEKGQEIVTSGQFLLDAETNLRSGFGSMEENGHAGH
jgi:Cu(I)/Ag(I) efflux system membrane fusion protein